MRKPLSSYVLLERQATKVIKLYEYIWRIDYGSVFSNDRIKGQVGQRGTVRSRHGVAIIIETKMVVCHQRQS